VAVIVALLTFHPHSSRTSQLQDSLRENTEMLKNIHTWWERNFKNAMSSDRRPEAANEPLDLDYNSTPRTSSISPFTFQVELADGQTTELVCPKTSLCDGWQDTPSNHLFACHCRDGSKHHDLRNIARECLSSSRNSYLSYLGA